MSQLQTYLLLGGWVGGHWTQSPGVGGRLQSALLLEEARGFGRPSLGPIWLQNCCVDWWADGIESCHSGFRASTCPLGGAWAGHATDLKYCL